MLRTLLAALALLSVAACERHPDVEAPAPPPALHETAAAEVAALCSEPLRAWAVLDEQGRILARSRGVCLGRVEHPEDGALWQFVAQLQHEGHARPSWELHTWLDETGRPRHAEFRTAELVTRFRWHEDTLIVQRLGDRLALDDAAQLWVTPTHGVYLHELMLRLGAGRDGQGLHQRGFVPDRELVSELELSLERLDHGHAQARAGDSVLALEGGDSLGAQHITTVLAGDAPIYRALRDDALAPFLPARPQPRYDAPESLELVPVTIPGEGGAPTLQGELVLARREVPVTQHELAGVLFIGGAGPQDRHGIVPASAVDIGSHELQDMLAAAGFAVLRVDDRGVGESGIGDDPTPGFAALVDDARRSLAALAAQPQVDPRRILLVGHGEGALVATILAGEGVRVGRRKRPLAGVVLLAAPGRNLRELVYDEIRASLSGRREGEIRTAVDRARRVHEAALAGEELPASSEGARRWMVEAFAEDPLARLAKVRAPVLALQGGKDFQVSPERDFEPIRAYLDARGPKGSEAELFTELDHLFKPEPNVSTPGHYADLRRHVDPALLERVTRWALELEQVDGQ